MLDFEQYFLLKVSDVAAYASQKLNYFDSEAQLEVAEIGDGNVNYIFRVKDQRSGKSVIVKQAGPTARISDAFVLSTERARIEANMLTLEQNLAPGLVPLLYKYDDVMRCCVMEDLSDHVIMRDALTQHQTFPLFADHITTFMVNTLLLTTDVVLDHKEKKEQVRKFINPELCEITEDLVYTEPFNNYKERNDVFLPNLDWVTQNIYQDEELRLEAAKIKFDFLTNAQALIHGDLHTGSIFIKPDSTKIIDPEFACYGPIGYDTGNIVANLIFAWANGDAAMDADAERAHFLGWVEQTLIEVVDLFRTKFNDAWLNHVSELTAKEPGFQTWYLNGVLRDTAAVIGLELCRRVIGLAHVKDITSIADEQSRLRAERICLTAAKEYIKNRENYRCGTDFLNTLKKTVEAYAVLI